MVQFKVESGEFIEKAYAGCIVSLEQNGVTIVSKVMLDIPPYGLTDLTLIVIRKNPTVVVIPAYDTVWNDFDLDDFDVIDCHENRVPKLSIDCIVGIMTAIDVIISMVDHEYSDCVFPYLEGFPVKYETLWDIPLEIQDDELPF
jgi:hypothetical protein